MRIALIYLGRRGAGGMINYEFARHLARNHHVRAYLCRDSEHLYLWQNEPLEKILFDTYRTSIQALCSIVYPFKQKNIIDEIRQFHPDILLFPMFHPWNAIIQKALRTISSIIFVHDPHPHPDLIGWFYSQLEKKSIQYAARCVVMSKSLAPELAERGVSINNIDIIPLGILNYSQNVPKKMHMERPTILFFGRISPYKGLDILLQAFEQVQKNQSCQLLIVGEGNLYPYLAAIQSTKNITVINRWIHENEIAGFFQQSDLVVLPYTSATQSGVIPIAASFALPVVATNTGGISEQIENGISGWLVEPGNINALAKAITEILEHPSLAKQRGFALRDYFLENFNWDNITHLVEEALMKAKQI